MDIKVRPTITRKDLVSVLEVMAEDKVGFGDVTRNFELKMSRFLQTDSIMTTSSVQMALFLLFKYLDIKEGDEIILSAYSKPFIIETLYFFKAKPIFVDIEDDSYLIDIGKVIQKITDKTKVILISHLLGYVVDMNPILELKNNHYSIIEDCSDALGVFYGNESVGKKGDFSIFSFDIFSPVNTLKGGAILSNIPSNRIKKLKNYLLDDNQNSDLISRMDISLSDIQSAMGISSLSLFDRVQKKKEEIGNYYLDCLKQSKLMFKNFDKNHTFSFNYFPVLSNNSLDSVQEIFKKRKIVVQKPIDRLYLDVVTSSEIKNTKILFSKLLLIPLYSLLKEEEVELIGKLIRSVE